MGQVQTVEKFESDVVKGESMILAGPVPLSLSVLKDPNDSYC